MEYESKRDTSDNRGNWNHFKSTQTILEQQTKKARNKGTTTDSHIGHCTHNMASTNVNVQNITLHVAQTVNTEQLQRYIP